MNRKERRARAAQMRHSMKAAGNRWDTEMVAEGKMSGIMDSSKDYEEHSIESRLSEEKFETLEKIVTGEDRKGIAAWVDRVLRSQGFITDSKIHIGVTLGNHRDTGERTILFTAIDSVDKRKFYLITGIMETPIVKVIQREGYKVIIK